MKRSKSLLSIIIITTVLISCIPFFMSDQNVNAATGNSYNLQVEGQQNYDACQEMMTYINQARTNAGVTPLVLDRDLTDAAMQRAAEIAYLFSHTRPNGLKNQTVSSSGRIWGENIAAGNSTAYSTHLQWMNSPPHKQSLLMASHRGIGLGHFYHNGKHFWVQVFSSSVGYVETRTGTVNTIMNFEIVETGSPLRFIGYSGTKSMSYGDSFRLRVGATNGGWSSATAAFRRYSFIWSTSNSSVVEVNDQGDIKAVGVGSATITAKTKIGNGSISLKVNVTKNFNDVILSSVPNAVYTGNAITPQVTATYKGSVLREGKDYRITYLNNVDAGVATVILEGIGEFTGSKSITFVISPIDIEKSAVVTLKAWDYGTEDCYDFLSKNLHVTYNGKTLVLDKDYEIAYCAQKSSVKKISSYQIRFIGNYSGFRQGKCLDIGKFSSIKNQNYSGSPILPDFYVRYKETDNNMWEKEFVEGVDYRTEYYNNIEAGTATITIYPLGDNFGQASVTFSIVYPPYKLSFDGNKGTSSLSYKIITYGTAYGKLPKAVRKGYEHLGWYTKAIGGTKVNSTMHYNFTENKTLYAHWKKVTVSKSSLKSLKKLKNKQLKVTVKAVSGAKGYQVVVSTSKKFTKNKKTLTGTAKIKTFKSMKKAKYYVRVRAYKYDSSGKKVYGKWSTVKTVRIK